LERKGKQRRVQKKARPQRACLPPPSGGERAKTGTSPRVPKGRVCPQGAQKAYLASGGENMGSEMMKVVNFNQGRIEMKEIPVPEPSSGEALIRVSMAAICNTDIELFKGYYDFSGIPGHEFVGVVVQAPDHRELEGKRVVADINRVCGHCPMCLSDMPGKRRHCINRKVLGIKGWDGAFAEFIVAPVENLHIVPDGLTDVEAVFAEPLAAALEPAQQIKIDATQRVLVMGDGKLGLLTSLALRHYNPNLTLVGKHPDKLSIAQAAGIKTILRGDPKHDDSKYNCENYLETDPKDSPENDSDGKPENIPEDTPEGKPEANSEDTLEANPADNAYNAEDTYVESAHEQIQEKYDIVIEATGSPEGINEAIEKVKAEGTIILKTTSHQPSCVEMSRIAVNEICVLGSRCGDLSLALSFLQKGYVNVQPLVEKIYPLEQFAEAFEHASRPGSKKVLLQIS